MIWILIMTTVFVFGVDKDITIESRPIQTFDRMSSCEVTRTNLYQGETRTEGRTRNFECVLVFTK